MMEIHFNFQGRVQGVCFRATVCEYAEEFGVKGTAKNLSDGSVEVIAQGEKEALEKFLKAIEHDPGLAQIDHVEKKSAKVKAPYTDFRIIH